MSDGQARPDLPDFAEPPVVEVALGIQFDAMSVELLDLAPLRERWRDRFPRLDSQPALPPNFETDTPASPGVQVLMGTPPMLRQWFLSEDRTELIQLQQDRLIVNWRAVAADVSYPRYEYVEELFRDASESLWEVLQERSGKQPEIRQVEVNYINAIAIPDHRTLPDVYTWWSSLRAAGHHLGEPMQVTVVMAFEVPDLGPPARLYVEVQPARDRKTSDLLMTLTIRGAPADTTRNAAIDFMGTAREHIVNSFTEMTTPEMHDVWGRRFDA